jgi:hypothetical protein
MANELINYSERFAVMAKEATEVEVVRGSGRFLSTKSGVLSFDDEPFPGNQVAAIVLDSVFENTYYEHDWKPGHIENPTCYAFGRTEDELGPHPAMQDDPDHFVPQHDECAGCPMAEWGSAKRGTGKACQQRRRLFMVPAGMFERAKNGGYDLTLVDDPEELAAFDPALLKVPVTSTKNWAKYVHEIAKEFNRPPLGVITRIYLEPDAKTQFQVKFELIDLVPDHMLEVVFKLHEAAKDQIITPYYVTEEND